MARNNWNTWRVAIRAQIRDNFVRDAKGETDGTSLDFVQRDALHYHVYDMSAWIMIADFTPCLLDANGKRDIEAGLSFLKPYYLGEKQHQEFVNTRVQEDRDRGRAGDVTFQAHRWRPEEGDDSGINRRLMRWARPIFPSIQPWTQQYEDTDYDPSVKFLAMLWGEPNRDLSLMGKR